MSESERFIHPTAQLNAPLRYLQGCVISKHSNQALCELPERLYIGAFAVIGNNVRLGENVVIENYVSIDPNVSVGRNTIMIYRAVIGGNTSIGEDCVIGGFVPEGTRIGNRCRVLGTMVHRHEDPAMNWDHHSAPEAAPIIHDDVFIGVGAMVIGGIEIGPRAYVCAGACVTRRIPPLHIASRSHGVIPVSEWRGALKDSDFFKIGE